MPNAYACDAKRRQRSRRSLVSSAGSINIYLKKIFEFAIDFWCDENMHKSKCSHQIKLYNSHMIKMSIHNLVILCFSKLFLTVF